MNKLMLCIAIVALLSSCKKENDVCPAPVTVSPVYSDTQYYLTNPSGRGEMDTINFVPSSVPNEYNMTPLLSSFTGVVDIDISGPELEVYYKTNGTIFFEGTGMFGFNELNIIWHSANNDTTDVKNFYSIYSKCRVN